MTEICTFVQKVLRDIEAKQYCDPHLFMGEMNYLMHISGNTHWRAEWKLQTSDWIFIRTIKLERYYDGKDVVVKLTRFEKKVLFKAYCAIEKNIIARDKHNTITARDWP